MIKLEIREARGGYIIHEAGTADSVEAEHIASSRAVVGNVVVTILNHHFGRSEAAESLPEDQNVSEETDGDED